MLKPQSPMKPQMPQRSGSHFRRTPLVSEARRISCSCLICKQSPSNPHHQKFAQPRALGRKVSDEFTVPLCRTHHQDLHSHGNEKAWWTNMQIAPLPIAKELWDASPIHGSASTTDLNLSSNISSESALR
jgi:hypothetical protein